MLSAYLNKIIKLKPSQQLFKNKQLRSKFSYTVAFNFNTHRRNSQILNQKTYHNITHTHIKQCSQKIIRNCNNHLQSEELQSREKRDHPVSGGHISQTRSFRLFKSDFCNEIVADNYNNKHSRAKMRLLCRNVNKGL